VKTPAASWATADNAVLKVSEVEKSLLQGDSVTQFNAWWN
jgi:methyl-accepting chemotaxis protein